MKSINSNPNRLKLFEWGLAALAFLGSGVASGCIVILIDDADPLSVFRIGEFWIPGFIFGLIFGSVALRERSSSLAFAALAALANYAALWTILILYLSELPALPTRLAPEPSPPFVSESFRYDHMVVIVVGVSSIFGAILLSRLSCLFCDRARRIRHDLTDGVLGLLIGTLSGLIYEADHLVPDAFRCIAAFGLWHLTVGLLVVWRATSLPLRHNIANFETRLVNFLRSPIVQLIGLLGLLYSLIDGALNKAAT